MASIVHRNIKYHKSLNPVAWDGDKIKPIVQAKLLTIADIFVDSINVDIKIQDIVLTGSNANYNWSEFSDFDVHVIVDFADFECEDIISELFNAKKTLWNQTHNVTIKGHDVEVYVENVSESHVSQGIFSLNDGKWIKKPTFSLPEINDAAVEAKTADLMVTIDHLIGSESTDLADYEKLMDKIRKMRQAGLANNGEFSTENLAFKILRNEGYLDKLRAAKNELLDKNLTIESNQNR